jgi:hypothetical protein
MEEPVVGVAVPLGGEQARPIGARHPAPYEMHVGFLAGLQHAEFRVHGGQFGDQPPGARLGAMRRVIPG